MTKTNGHIEETDGRLADAESLIQKLTVREMEVAMEIIKRYNLLNSLERTSSSEVMSMKSDQLFNQKGGWLQINCFYCDYSVWKMWG